MIEVWKDIKGHEGKYLTISDIINKKTWKHV